MELLFLHFGLPDTAQRCMNMMVYDDDDNGSPTAYCQQ